MQDIPQGNLVRTLQIINVVGEEKKWGWDGAKERREVVCIKRDYKDITTKYNT